MGTRGGRVGERQLVSLLQQRFGGSHSAVRIAIGDDAAVLHRLSGDSVCSVDVNVEGVHFNRQWLTLQDVGFRAMQGALSDLAAMGAAPVASLSSWILPRNWRQADSNALAEGLQRASVNSGCPIVGGNISRGGELSVTTTVLGESRGGVLRRNAARPGEQLWLVGQVGEAAAGLSALRCWSSHQPWRLEQPGVSQCVAAWRTPRALLVEGQRLAAHASAAVDISDGLAEDARQLAEASGVRLIIDERLLQRALSAALRRAGRALGRAPLHWALNGGEDYALLATGSAHLRPDGCSVIGSITRGRGALLDGGGRLQSLAAGFDHLK